MPRRHAERMSPAPSWAALWNRDLVESLGPAFQTHIGAVNRKWNLRYQMMQFRDVSVVGQGGSIASRHLPT